MEGTVLRKESAKFLVLVVTERFNSLPSYDKKKQLFKSVFVVGYSNYETKTIIYQKANIKNKCHLSLLVNKGLPNYYYKL